MDYSAHWTKFTARETPFRTGWTWIITGFSVAFIGALLLLLSIGWENLTGSAGWNPILLGLLAMAGIGLSHVCGLVAMGWMGNGIIRMFYSPTP